MDIEELEALLKTYINMNQKLHRRLLRLEAWARQDFEYAKGLDDVEEPEEMMLCPQCREEMEPLSGGGPCNTTNKWFCYNGHGVWFECSKCGSTDPEHTWISPSPPTWEPKVPSGPAYPGEECMWAPPEDDTQEGE